MATKEPTAQPRALRRGDLVAIGDSYWAVIGVAGNRAWLTRNVPWCWFRVVPVDRCERVPNVMVESSPWEIN